MSNWNECIACKIYDDQRKYCRYCGAAQNIVEPAQQTTNKQCTPLCPKCKSEDITIYCRFCDSTLLQGNGVHLQ